MTMQLGINTVCFVLSDEAKGFSMRIVKSLFVAGALVASVPTLAHAQWYVSTDAGVSLDQASKVTSATTSGQYNTKYNPGYAVLGAVGYSYGAPKVELELGYRSNAVSSIGGSSASGNVGAFSGMVNGLYDFNANGQWHPIFGLGIGTGHVDASGLTVGGASSYGVNSWQFAYQGIAQLGYDISSNWQARIDYRYFSTLDASGSVNGSSVKDEYHNQTVLLGITYKFNSPAPMPPAPEPVPVPVAAPAPPPPPPAPAPVALKNYIVFFDFDQASINEQAEAIIEQAVAMAKKGHVVHIQLTGHTDQAGSAEYNQKLSIRRAEAVKAALVKLGLSASEIGVVGKGKTDPLVPTKDGMRQPQNRRVEIVLQ